MKRLKQVGEDLIAAPPSLVGSEAEKTRALTRKALASAEAARLRASKRKRPPTPEQILADLIRVASDKDTNPLGWKFQSITARRYALYGNYPVEFVLMEYGQFSHALEVAGIRDTPATRKTLAAKTEASRHGHARRYAEATMLPYAVDEPKVRRAIDGVTTVMIASDLHSTYLCPEVWSIFLASVREIDPEYIVLNGDVLEGSAISRHPKIPGAVIPLQLEFEFARELFRQLREAAPTSEIIFTGGNHGIDRWASYLSQQAPALASLESMRFDRLLGLEEHAVTIAMGGHFCAPEGQEDDMPGINLGGQYYIRHGVSLGKTPAHSELASSGMSGSTGHVHRAGMAFTKNMAGRQISHMTTPMACREEAGRHYIKAPSAGWQRGFGIAHLMPGGAVHQYPVVIQDGRALIEGRVYEADVAGVDTDPMGNWLPSMA
jgi:hypothetical protein